MSAAEFLERLFGDLAGLIADEDELRATWADPDNRERFLEQLSDHGYDQSRLEDIRHLVDAPRSDLFDVLGYVLFAHAPKTRHERAEDVRRGGIPGVGEEMRQLLLGILRAYETHGEGELATPKARFILDWALWQRDRGEGTARRPLQCPQCLQANSVRPLCDLKSSLTRAA